jgi:tellurite resistance protein
MGIKETFTNEEWKNLLELPYAVGLTVIIVSPSGPIGIYHESKELLQEPSKLAAQSGSSGLVNVLAVELQTKAKEIMKEQQNEIKHTSPAAFKDKTLKACGSAASALGKTTAEEASAYKHWVLALGQKVAEAAKEHGVLVSPEESAVLQEISKALGTS